MSEDKDFIDKFFDFIKTPFKIYLTFIILIILFPPMNYKRGNRNSFEGWDFIYWLGNGFEINVIYLLLEIGIATLVYFIYLQSKKK
jgi:hypothetical protein